MEEESQDGCKTCNCHLGKEEAAQQRASPGATERKATCSNLFDRLSIKDPREKNRTILFLSYKSTPWRHHKRIYIYIYIYMYIYIVKRYQVNRCKSFWKQNPEPTGVGVGGNSGRSLQKHILFHHTSPDVSSHQWVWQSRQCWDSSILHSCRGHFTFHQMPSMCKGHSCAG